MKATEFLTGNYENVTVNYFADSYQYAEPKTFTVKTAEEFAEVKHFTENKLKYSKTNSTKEAQKATFWATFTAEDGTELFEERVRL